MREEEEDDNETEHDLITLIFIGCAACFGIASMVGIVAFGLFAIISVFG